MKNPDDFAGRPTPLDDPILGPLLRLLFSGTPAPSEPETIAVQPPGESDDPKPTAKWVSLADQINGEPYRVRSPEQAADEFIAILVQINDEDKRSVSAPLDRKIREGIGSVPKTALGWVKRITEFEHRFALNGNAYRTPIFRAWLVAVIKSGALDADFQLPDPQNTADPATCDAIQLIEACRGQRHERDVTEGPSKQIPLDVVAEILSMQFDKEAETEQLQNLLSSLPSKQPAETNENSDEKCDDSAFVAAKMPPESPKELLFGWPEILDAVRRVDDDATRTLVARLNKETNGPIQVKQGGKVTADKAKLIPWWNNLENRFIESEQQTQNRDATVSESYGYGKEGEVVPDIGGHVRKRRGKR